jgi:hypothetical protein
MPKPKEPVTYRLKVWQLMQGQSSVDAMRSNSPIVTKDVANITQATISNLYTGPCRPPYLCDYIWSVEALNSNDLNSGKNFGMSNAFTFKLNEEKPGAVKSSGDPIYGVDIKLGFETKNQCDPIHGVDIKLGAIARNAQGDPIHGVDIKLGATATNAQGDPIHGVDVKLGAVSKNLNAQGDPVHGVDIKVGAIAKNQGDPIYGVDVKLGFQGKKEDVDQIQSVDVIVTVRATNANGDPVHGVDVKVGVKSVSANGDPVHGVDVKLGLKNQAQGDPIYGVDIKLGAKSINREVDGKGRPAAKSLDKELPRPHPFNIPIEKITYDAAGNILEIVLRTKEGVPVPKVVVAGSGQITGDSDPQVKCKTVYCHNPLHPPGCGWQECK